VGVALVHEAAGDRAGTGIHVFVMAPHCEVRAAVVQLQRQIADRMCQVEAGDRAGGVCKVCDLPQLERLAGAVLHAGPQHQRQARSVLGDRALDRLHRERAVLLVGFQFDQVGSRIEAVEANLRFERMAIGRERTGLHQDRWTLARRAIEADHHQVQVGGQRVHRHHFARLRADQGRERLAYQGVVGHPRRGLAEMSFHGFLGPFVQHLLDVRAHAARLQAERVAAEVGLLVIAVPGNQEFGAK